MATANNRIMNETEIKTESFGSGNTDFFDANTVSHMTMLEGNISRMHSASAHCKGWAVAVATATGILSSGGMMAILVLALLCIMDAYYLALERGFRKLFEEVRISCETDFRMDVSASPGSVLRAVKSVSVAPLYLVLMAAVLVVAVGGI